MYKITETYRRPYNDGTPRVVNYKPKYYVSKDKYEAGMDRFKKKYSKKPKLINASGPGLPTISMWDGVVFNPGEVTLTAERKISIDEDIWEVVEVWTNP